MDACRAIVARQGRCKTCEAVITTSGKLPSKFVIHTVGPVWNGGEKGEAEKLANCYKNALLLAEENHCKSVAFPSISTGIYGYPKQEAAHIAVSTTKAFMNEAKSIELVIFVCFDAESYHAVKSALNGGV